MPVTGYVCPFLRKLHGKTGTGVLGRLYITLSDLYNVVAEKDAGMAFFCIGIESLRLGKDGVRFHGGNGGKRDKGGLRLQGQKRENVYPQRTQRLKWAPTKGYGFCWSLSMLTFIYTETLCVLCVNFVYYPENTTRQKNTKKQHLYKDPFSGLKKMYSFYVFRPMQEQPTADLRIPSGSPGLNWLIP